MPEIVILIFELIGTVSFAASGAMTGIKKGMDTFGVAILGLCTAVGGGAIRDVVLGITPPTTFVNPVYAVVALLTAVMVFLPGSQRFLKRKSHMYDRAMFLMDTLGLSIFTVVGIRTAMLQDAAYGVFLLIFVGVITGVGGGILRDVLAGNTPYVFVKHFYACASIIGAVLCILLWNLTGQTIAMTVGATAIVGLRFFAAHYKWSLPKANI
ncbi:MAG: trimeric intracellular cation channel family protein [Ruminococcaceae bacterium]|nr:trimeric intracellular cation channel family protein [Oscillospiraceae bacterium]